MRHISNSEIQNSIFDKYDVSHLLLERITTNKQYNTIGNIHNINIMSKQEIKNFETNFDTFKMIHGILLKDFIVKLI